MVRVVTKYGKWCLHQLVTTRHLVGQWLIIHQICQKKTNAWIVGGQFKREGNKFLSDRHFERTLQKYLFRHVRSNLFSNFGDTTFERVRI